MATSNGVKQPGTITEKLILKLSRIHKKIFQKYGCLEEFIFADVKLFLRQLTFEKKGFKHVSNFWIKIFGD